MRKNIILLLIIFICSHANAEKLIFSNNNEQVNITGDVVIDNQNGDITVTTAGGNFLIVNENQPVILGFYPDSYATTVQGSVGVSWSVANADTCVASTVSGNSDWTGPKTATDGKNPPTPETVTFSSLPTTLRLTCSNVSDSVTEEFTVNAESTVATDPTINFFRVNGSSSPTVNVSGNNATAVISWSTSDINNCEASSTPTLSGWNSNAIGTSGTTDELSITISSTVTLECDNLPAASIIINYTPGGNPACDGLRMPSLITQEPERISYTALNEGNPFGVSNDTNARYDFSINKYMEISGFSTNIENFYRILFFPTAPTGSNTSFIQSISISECPGDFNEDSAACVFLVSPQGSTQKRITTNQNETNPDICKIQTNTSYYMNVIHDRFPFDATAGRCASPTDTTCALFFSETTDQAD